MTAFKEIPSEKIFRQLNPLFTHMFENNNTQFVEKVNDGYNVNEVIDGEHLLIAALRYMCNPVYYKTILRRFEQIDQQVIGHAFEEAIVSNDCVAIKTIMCYYEKWQTSHYPVKHRFSLKKLTLDLLYSYGYNFFTNHEGDTMYTDTELSVNYPPRPKTMKELIGYYDPECKNVDVSSGVIKASIASGIIFDMKYHGEVVDFIYNLKQVLCYEFEFNGNLNYQTSGCIIRIHA